MTKLPANFPSDKLGIIERMQVEWFYTRYTEEFYADYLFGHFMMAAYAAIPAFLTPDMLYKLWQNFGEYQWGGKAEFIHPIAVSDVLLAPFCQEISYELFKMEEQTRLSFLKWMNSGDLLWTNRKPHAPEEIANFIASYHDKPNDTMVREGEKYREDQLMEVNVYQDPASVAEYYLQKLHTAKEKNNEQDILAVINALNKAREKERYTRYSNKNIFSTLFKENELTLWKHVIQQNNNSFANLLEQSHHQQPDGSLLLSNKQDNAHKIQISNTEVRLVNQLDSLVKQKNYAVLIGCSASDVPNCKLFADTLEIIGTSEKWELQTFAEPIPKEELLKRLKKELEAISPYDNLVIYLSASQSKLEEPATCLLNYFIWQLTNEDFSEIFAGINPGSFSLILECRNASTSFWLDTNKPGYAVFAAPSFDNHTTERNLETVYGGNVSSTSIFTTAFCAVLSAHYGKISHRQLFVRTINEIKGNFDQDGPVLRSNRATYYRQFVSGDLQTIKVQHMLRLCGYLDKPESIDWDDSVEVAYNKFLTDHQSENDLSEVSKKLNDEIEIKLMEKKPILLFVFYDPEKKLPAITQEIASIKDILKNSPVGERNEIKIIRNRPLKEVDDFITNATNRNRIQLFYYSGFDNNGFPKFTDGEINLELWSRWLAYQDHVELTLLNTCRAGYLARQLTQIGVGMAIGSYEVINDDESAEFGIKLMETIASEGKLTELPVQ